MWEQRMHVYLMAFRFDLGSFTPSDSLWSMSFERTLRYTFIFSTGGESSYQTNAS